MLTYNPPGRGAELWEIPPNGKPDEQIAEPTRVVDRVCGFRMNMLPRARMFLYVRTRGGKETVGHRCSHKGWGIQGWAGDSRVTWGRRGAGVFPCSLHQPPPKIHAPEAAPLESIQAVSPHPRPLSQHSSPPDPRIQPGERRVWTDQSD